MSKVSNYFLLEVQGAGHGVAGIHVLGIMESDWRFQTLLPGHSFCGGAAWPLHGKPQAEGLGWALACIRMPFQVFPKYT